QRRAVTRVSVRHGSRLASVGTLDAMTERAGIKKPEGRACASPPLRFSAAATAAGTKILLARRDAGSGFGTRPIGPWRSLSLGGPNAIDLKVMIAPSCRVARKKPFGTAAA